VDDPERALLEGAPEGGAQGDTASAPGATDPVMGVSMGDGVDWPAYYRKEAEISDFDPAQGDEAEVLRCEAAWSVFPPEQAGSMLDVGCGEGHFCGWVKDRGGPRRVVGLDISRTRLERARSRRPGVHFVEGQITHMPFGESAFDVVTCVEVLEHMESPSRVLAECARVAGRWVVVTVPDGERLRRALCPHCLRTFPLDGHLASFDRTALEGLAQDCGLRVECLTTYRRPVVGMPRPLGAAVRRLQSLLFPAPGLYLAARMRKG